MVRFVPCEHRNVEQGDHSPRTSSTLGRVTESVHRLRAFGTMRTSAAATFGVLMLAACGRNPNAADARADGSDAADDSSTLPRPWPCPRDWVPYARGGCAPAVIACVPGGGGDPSSCTSADIGAPRTIALADGGMGWSFALGPDGGLRGGWVDERDVGIPSCPTGWRRVAGACDPALGVGCEDPRAAIPGDACAATSSRDCPAGDYAVLPAEAMGAPMVYVREGADPLLADGSLARPYATLATALTNVPVDGWMMVSAGRYADSLSVSRSVHILGACAARTTIRGADPIGTIVSRGVTTRLDIRGVTVSGAGPGIHAVDGSIVRVRNVVVSQATTFGIGASERAALDLADVVVTGTRRSGMTFGRGLNIDSAATLDAVRTVVADCASVGVHVSGAGTTATLRDSLIARTALSPVGNGGHGVNAQVGARVRLERVVIEASHLSGLRANGASDATLTDVVIRGSLALPNGTGGYGIEVTGGSTLAATRALLEGNTEAGALVTTGAHVQIVASTVRGTLGRGDGRLGDGLALTSGSVVDATDVLIEDNRECGACAFEPNTRLTLTRSLVRRSLPRSDGTGGLGCGAASGATLEIRQSVVEDQPDVLVLVNAARATIEDSALRGTRPEGAASRGIGVLVAGRSTVDVSRVVLERLATVGFDVTAAAHDCGDTTLRDVIVRDVRPGPNGFGIGMHVFGDCRVDAQRLALVSATGAALATTSNCLCVDPGLGGTVHADDVFVQGVRTGTIEVTVDGMRTISMGRPVAYGVQAAGESTLVMSRAVIDSGGFGFMRAPRAQLRIVEGNITRQLDAAGASSGGGLELTDVATFDNANNGTVSVQGLPESAALPAPSPVCAPENCP